MIIYFIFKLISSIAYIYNNIMGRKNIKHIEDIKQFEVSETESEISQRYEESEDSLSSSSSIVAKKPSTEKIVKPPKEKKPYVLTPARKEQFEKARIKRAENIEIKKIAKNKENEEHELLKQDLIRKKELKTIRKKAREIKRIVQTVESESEEEVIVKRKPKKKVIVYESSSDEEIVKKKPPKKELPPAPPATPVRRVMQFF